jgi:16S rRNA A1518/A1519 N6-dimethyltransferase RsmA/KsgA/DIM1 with predicted DNA glycosylase/AP lyase activity
MPAPPAVRVEVIDGVEYAHPSSEWTKKLEKEFHWQLYWRQQNVMNNLIQPGDHLLEIGPGSGFTTNYLRSKGIQVTTLDLNPDKKPDIVANIAQ